MYVFGRHFCTCWRPAEHQAAWESHGWTHVWAAPIMTNYPSICRASPGAGSAEKHGKKKSERERKKEKMRFLRGEGKKTPRFGLPTFCWLLVVRKWERARFSPPENNTNPSKLKSNTQSTSQETILKRKTSQWELHLNAAGMHCLTHPLCPPPLPSCSFKASTTT